MRRPISHSKTGLWTVFPHCTTVCCVMQISMLKEDCNSQFGYYEFKYLSEALEVPRPSQLFFLSWILKRLWNVWNNDSSVCTLRDSRKMRLLAFVEQKVERAWLPVIVDGCVAFLLGSDEFFTEFAKTSEQECRPRLWIKEKNKSIRWNLVYFTSDSSLLDAFR